MQMLQYHLFCVILKLPFHIPSSVNCAVFLLCLYCNHSFFPPTGLALPPAFPTMVDNHVSHNYMGAMEPKPVYPPPQVTPSRYSPVPRHMLGEEDFTR